MEAKHQYADLHNKFGQRSQSVLNLHRALALLRSRGSKALFIYLVETLKIFPSSKPAHLYLKTEIQGLQYTIS